VDATGNLYVADTSNSVIRKITPNKVVTTLAGTAGLVAALMALARRPVSRSPTVLQPTWAAMLYVADSNNNAIRKITPAGAVTTLAGLTAQSGFCQRYRRRCAVQYSHRPCGSTQQVPSTWLTRYNQTIRKVAAGAVVTTLAGVGECRAIAILPRLVRLPAGLATDAAGNVYVGDAVNSAVREITPAGTVSTPAKGLPIMSPTASAVDAGGNVYVADVRATVSSRSPMHCQHVRWHGARGIRQRGPQDGHIRNPRTIAIDTAGTLYVGKYRQQHDS